MSSGMTTVAHLFSASPLGEGERTEVRGSPGLMSLNPHPTLSLGKGEAIIVRMI
jgi:hypothetical protein